MYGLSCVQEFIGMLVDLRSDVIIYSHNLTFDGSFIIKELSYRGIEFNSLIIDCSIFYINFLNKMDYKIEFKCSYKLIPISLKNM